MKRPYSAAEGDFEIQRRHEVIDRKEFDEIDLLKRLQGKAAKHLGTSGSGNHFVEFGDSGDRFKG